MHRRVALPFLPILASSIFTMVISEAAFGQQLPNLFPFADPFGLVTTFNTNNNNGPIDLSGPFFQSLGTNGRSCVSCHMPSDGWTVSAAHVRERFELTGGLDPIFRTVDGSNCNHNIQTATVEERREAYSLLVRKGLIRIALPVPAGAEFDVVSVVNQYGCNEFAPLSMYRRPLPSTNLRFLSTVMWDGRESSIQTGTTPIAYASYPQALVADLEHQALDATNGHAQGNVPLTTAQQQAIREFEMGLFTAQSLDFRNGPLNSDGSHGGPQPLATQPFFIGINDPLGGNPFGTPFSPIIFTLFNAGSAGADEDDAGRRASIVRGEAIFNSKAIVIRGVGGLNDMTGNCGTCHSTPNVGNHSLSAPLNIGVADLTNPLGVDYLPVITLQNIATGQRVQTTDPGRALITGKWADIGKLKGPILRGLASRAPYFHNGSADTLEDVIRFYDVRFHIGLSEQEKADLAAFLKAL